jgi:hypothetical protein
MIKKKEVEPLTINGPDGTPLVTIRKYIVSGDIVELLRSLDDRDMHWERIADEAADEIERLRGFASWILEAYDSDEWPTQKDIVAGAREAIGDE